VVVRLDLERDGEPVADIDDTGVRARALEDSRAAARQPLQQEGRVLVSAVLGPEDGEDRELEVVLAASEQVVDAVALPVGETERSMKRLLRDCGQTASLPAASDGSARTAGCSCGSKRCRQGTESTIRPRYRQRGTPPPSPMASA